MQRPKILLTGKQGMAVGRGPEGKVDDRSVFTLRCTGMGR